MSIVNNTPNSNSSKNNSSSSMSIVNNTPNSNSSKNNSSSSMSIVNNTPNSNTSKNKSSSMSIVNNTPNSNSSKNKSSSMSIVNNTPNSNTSKNKSSSMSIVTNTPNSNTSKNKSSSMSIVNNTPNSNSSQSESKTNNNCPHNSCPYMPRKVLTEKQAEKEPIGSFYHPTKKTYRTGACDIGYVLKRGYERESYKKKDGTIVNATYIDPICIKNKGLSGKLLEEYKPIHLNNKNELSPYGYDTKLKIHERLSALIKAVDKLTYKSVILRISALRTLHKNNPHYYKLFDKDLKNLQLLHTLDEFGYKINISDSRRMIALKKASDKLTFKKVLSILKKLRNIYKTDEVYQNVFNEDISKIEEYYKK